MSVARHGINIDSEAIARFCRQNRVRKMSLFGSVLRDDFGPESDLDVLVELEPDARVGLIGFAGLEIELSQLLGRKVDLNTLNCLSKSFRDQVQSEAEVLYAAA